MRFTAAKPSSKLPDMPILTHGSDLTLAPTVGPVVRQLALPLADITQKLAQTGFGSIQLDATLPGIRPRELSTSGRRDLLAMLRRRGVTLAGLDLFIPRKDFLDSQKVERATEAALAGIELAADLGRVPLSIPLPIKQIDPAVLDVLLQGADGRGVTLAIHAEDQLPELSAWLTKVDQAIAGIAIDPAAILAQGADADQVIHQHASRLAVARLSDFTITGGGDEDGDGHATGLRCIVGQGELSVPSYRIALDLATARKGPVVLDLRNMENTLQAAMSARKAWDNAGFSF